MTFNLTLIVVGLVGALFLIAAVRNARRRRIVGALLSGALSLAFFAAAAAGVVLAANLRTYQRLIAEQPAGELQFTRLGYRQYNGAFTFPSGDRADFALRGDEWQIDARILKWRPLANLAGFDTLYRLDRISGRYTNAEDERSQLRTVYPLNPPDRVDIWELAQRFHSWIPGLDAFYGSAAFLPMADGASYDIKITQSGVIARPRNSAAHAAVDGWHST